MKINWKNRALDAERQLHELRGDLVNRSNCHIRDIERLNKEVQTWTEHALMLGRTLSKLTR